MLHCVPLDPDTEFRSYHRGRSRNDFALTTPLLACHMKIISYEPFSYRLKGDHRGFYFDIPEKVIFGNTQDPVYPANSRKLNSKDAKAVSAYIPSVYHIYYITIYSNAHRSLLQVIILIVTKQRQLINRSTEDAFMVRQNANAEDLTGGIPKSTNLNSRNLYCANSNADATEICCLIHAWKRGLQKLTLQFQT